MRRIVAIALVAAGLHWPAPPSLAAELRLRSQCTAAGALVTLGDVAEVVARDKGQAQTLAAVELFPAPGAGRQRFVRVRELQDLLMLHGVNLAEHRFSGANQVTIQGAGPPPRNEAELAPSAAASKRANRRVQDAIVRYLQQQTSADQPWIVQLDLGDEHARAIANASREIRISGGAPPWEGSQSFEVTVPAADPPERFAVEARVEAPAACVVTVRSLSRGVVIRETDVELQRNAPREGAGEPFYSLEEVVGKETARAIPVGKNVTHDCLRAPLLVRRGDVVTVYARTAGIRIRTTARAKDDGSQGDLIPVESLQDRASYLARVCAIREVEVFARSAQSSDAAPAMDPQEVGSTAAK